MLFRSVNYVYYATRHSDLADRIVHTDAVVGLVRALLGSDTWLLDYERFGVVYQDARPGPTSGYNRIGWHTDRQSGPHLEIWPSTAFTIHLDATSPPPASSIPASARSMCRSRNYGRAATSLTGSSNDANGPSQR